MTKPKLVLGGASGFIGSRLVEAHYRQVTMYAGSLRSGRRTDPHIEWNPSEGASMRRSLMACTA